MSIELERIMEWKNKPLIPILLVGFIPTASVIFGIEIIENELYSQIFFALCKVWIFLVPTVWYLKVEKNSISKNLPSKEGLNFGLITGVLMSLIILITWFLFDETLDISGMSEILQSKGLDSLNLYIIGMFYWIFINLSLIHI